MTINNMVIHTTIFIHKQGTHIHKQNYNWFMRPVIVMLWLMSTIPYVFLLRCFFIGDDICVASDIIY